MQNKFILACAALALTGVGAAAVAQSVRTAPTPFTMRDRQTHPQANTAGGAGRADAQIGELQAQIDALKLLVDAQQNTIQGMKTQLQKVALGGFANKGDVSKLETQLGAMGPAIQTLQIADRDTSKAIAAANGRLSAVEGKLKTTHEYRMLGQQGDKQVMVIMPTYMTSEHCTKLASGYIDCKPVAQ